MRNRSQKTAETLLLEPTKNKEKACKPPGQTQERGVWDAHAKKQNPSRFCARAIAKPKRRFWNPLKRKKYSAQKRKKYSAHTIRNRSQKSAETLFLEPTKNKEKRLRKVASSKAQRNVRLKSLQATRLNSRKRCPSRVLCRSHCETAARKMPKRRFWNPLKRKKYSAQKRKKTAWGAHAQKRSPSRF